MAQESRRKDGVFCAATSALSALSLLAPALLRGEGLMAVGMLWRVPPWTAVLKAQAGSGVLADQLLYFLPWRQFLREELLAGRLPLWNPYLLGGVPFAACVQAAPFFPVNLLLFWLPAAPFSLVAAFLKIFFSGFFTALHVRRLGVSREGASLAGLAFSLGGFMVAWLGHPQTNTACLLPALFWAAGRLSDEPGPRSASVLGLFIGLALLGGHPPTMLHVFSVLAAYAFFLGARVPSPGRRRLIAYSALALLAGACLAAPALLPYIEYVRLSSTPAASELLARWNTRLSPWLGLHLLMPLASGSPARGAEVLAGVFGLERGSNFIERAAWTGALPLLLAGVAVVRRRSDGTILFHFGLAAAGLAAALGIPPLPWVWENLPGYSAVNPTRLLLAWNFGVAVLAGIGWDCCMKSDGREKRRLTLMAAGCVASVALAYAWKIWGAAAELTASEISFALSEEVYFAVEAGIALWLVWRFDRLRRFGLIFAGLALLRYSWDVNASAAPELAYPPTPAIAAIRSTIGEGRFFGLGAAVEPNLGMPFGLRDSRGRDFIVPSRYERLVTGDVGDFGFYSGSTVLPPTWPLLSIGVVAATARTAAAVPKSWTAIHQGDVSVYRSPVAPKRALFVPQARAADSEAVLAAVRDPAFDMSRMLWLDDGPVAAPQRRARGQARIVEDGVDRVVVDVDSDGPGWLLLLDNWFTGWEAPVDAAPARVRRGDYAFRAVEVPGGQSRVRFVYRPRSFWLGVAAAFAAACALGAVFLRR